MRNFAIAIVAVSLLVTNALADTTLPAGKPSGVRKAQAGNPSTLLIIGGVGLAGLGIGLAASSNGNRPTSTTSSVTGTP